MHPPLIFILIAAAMVLLVILVPKLPEENPVTVAAPRPLSEREKVGGRWMALTYELYYLGETIAEMRSAALALDTGDGGDYSDMAREKRIILEQIRIAGSYHDEIERYLAEERTADNLNKTKWPFTAAELQMQFAQNRLDQWPVIHSNSRKPS